MNETIAIIKLAAEAAMKRAEEKANVAEEAKKTQETASAEVAFAVVAEELARGMTKAAVVKARFEEKEAIIAFAVAKALATEAAFEAEQMVSMATEAQRKWNNLNSY